MKPFTLENVLAYRKRLEDIAQNRFFEAKKNQQQVEKKLAEENGILADLTENSERLQSEGIAITDLIRYEERILQVNANIRAIAKTLAEKNDIVAQEQRNLINRAKERQMMERLKTQQNNAWKTFLNKQETAMLDEIALNHHDSKSQ
jgi:flagellar protein FliJ